MQAGLPFVFCGVRVAINHNDLSLGALATFAREATRSTSRPAGPGGGIATLEGMNAFNPEHRESVSAILTKGRRRMRPISTEGFEKPESVAAGAVPMLQWMKIADLVIDSAYQRPITGKGRVNVDRIASSFSWSCFSPVVVSPVEGGKFAIIDGQHRTTAAAILGIECVPCQVVIAAQEGQAAAFEAINATTTPISQMALHAAALVANEPLALQIAHVCARADVELLRYPVAVDKQRPGQTMAAGAIARCLKQYGEATLIAALQCVTRTSNNKTGALSARMIKTLCAVLHGNPIWPDQGAELLEAFDSVDLIAIQDASAVDVAKTKVGRVQAMSDRINAELNSAGLLRSRGRTSLTPSPSPENTAAQWG
jgi:ParB-like nuclease domain